MSNTLLQPAAFLAMMYGGVISGLIYDFFRIIRRLFNRPLVNIVFDALFLLCGAFVSIVSFLFASGGEIRPYLCLGLAVGFFAERWSLGFLLFRGFCRLRGMLFKNNSL